MTSFARAEAHPAAPPAAVGGFAAVLDAAQRGDEAAFTALYRSNHPVVLRYLHVLCRAGAARSGTAGLSAEDLAAETWVAAVRGLRRFTGTESELRGWLVTIARARWVDAVRAAGRRPEVASPQLPEQVATDDVEAAVHAAMATRSALALIARLPADQAEVVTLRIVADLDVAEVAGIVGKTPNHVRVLTHRGLRRLAAILDEDAAVMRSPERTMEQA